MSYQPYLISKYATGFDNESEPWLLPDDAQEVLYDGFVYRGVWSKRPGYTQYATGERGNVPYCESRMVHKLSAVAPTTGVIDGANKTFTWTATGPLRRGGFVITGSSPAQTLTDNGLGGFTGDGTGTINYTTGAVSVTFTTAPAGASTVLATYSYHPGYPVMMVASFYTDTNTRQLIVADTHYVNRFNSTTNRLDDISQAAAYTGNNSNFFSWCNYPPAAGTARLVFANNKDTIQQYDGSTVAAYGFTLTGVTLLTCLQLFQMKDRLILLRTTEDGTTYPRRIRISGVGADCDVFDVTSPGAGVIDIPDDTWIMGAAFNRDDLIIYTETSTWIMKYTGSDIVPFVLDRLDPSRGNQAPFAPFTYLNKTTAGSPNGFTVSDGYRVERYDNKIPKYSFNSINTNRYSQCFSGNVSEDRDHYLIHPSPGQEISDRILVMNYEEDNFSVYRISLSCMGDYIESFETTWNDLAIYDTWEEMSAVFGNWNAFAYKKGVPLAIGGGHNGQIWRLNVNAVEDNTCKIRGMTVINSTTLQITTDYNTYVVGDEIFINDPSGMVEADKKQAAIKTVTNAYTFTLDIDTTGFSAYTSGGEASRVIPFECFTKKFNPFAAQDQKIRCGYMYMYISASDVSTTDHDGNAEKCFIDIYVIVNDYLDTTQVQNSSLQWIQKPYRINCTSSTLDEGTKRWYKIYINQVGRFIQFVVKNQQAGAQIQIQAMMPGFGGVGRLI